MLLAFDVGNTNIVLGLFRERELVCNWRMMTDKNKSADEYGMLINQLFAFEGMSPGDVSEVIIATVVPSMIYTLQHLSIKYFKRRAIVVGPGIKTGLIVKYDNPKLLGADRIVNAVAAMHLYKPPMIVVDFGTATTFCALSDKSEYLGGVIAPGIKIAADALFEKTAKLPRVDLVDPGKTLCRNTSEGIQAGLVYGSMGMVEYIIRRMKKEVARETDWEGKVNVVATGGLATLIETGVDCIDYVDKLLTLTGLELIYEKNRGGRSGSARREVHGDEDL